MKDEISQVREALDEFVRAKQKLRELDAIRSERVTGEIGEWFAEKLTGARRAETTSQTGWDLLLGDKRIQVKCHAKGDQNNARWTQWTYKDKLFDELIILVFNKELYLNEAYRMTYEQAHVRVKWDQKQVVLRWDDCTDFRIRHFPKELEPFLM